MTHFNPLYFAASHAGMSLADAVKEAYEQGKRDAQSERKTGKWLPEAEDWRNQIIWVECSECGFNASTSYNFCPNCGSKNKQSDDEK